jgi:hypothetical protein
MPQEGFEPTIPAFERAKTVHASDRPVTVIGLHVTNSSILLCSIWPRVSNSIGMIHDLNGTHVAAKRFQGK